MKKETITLYTCEFCGAQSTDEEEMVTHELICPLNPINQPCSTCKNQLIGYGCIKKMPMENIGGKVKCFFYEEGSPMTSIPIFDGGKID